MKIHQKFGRVIQQIFVGLGFGLGGAFITAVLIGTYYEMTQMRLGAFGESVYALGGSYVGIQAGIAFDGYRFLKKNRRQANFLRCLGQSIAGLILGLVLLVAILRIRYNEPVIDASFLVIVLPLTGAIVGFNFRHQKTSDS